MELIKTEHDDLGKIAECHRACFPKSLSSAMGKAYCSNMLSWYLDCDKAFIFHISEGNQCVGYCGGVINDGTLTTGSASAMMQHSLKSAIISFMTRPYLLFHRELRKKYTLFFKNLLSKVGVNRFNTKKEVRTEMAKKPAIGLVVIGVRPEYQGKGASKLLLAEFEDSARRYKIEDLKLSVLASNKRAIAAYTKNGWFEEKRTANSVNMIKQL